MREQQNYFTIGEISKLFQMNIRTLRFYDDAGIFKPAGKDPKSGYRYYTTEQFEQLNTVKYLRTLGMSLKDIGRYLEQRDLDNALELMEHYKEETQQRIEELRLVEQKLDNRMGQIRDALDPAKLGSIREEVLRARTIAFLDADIARNEDLEVHIRSLENLANLQSSVFLGKIGLSVSAERARERRFDRYQAIFSIAENEQVPEQVSRALGAGKYVMLRFHGTHEDAGEYYERLMDYVEGKGYEVKQDLVEITLIDYGLTTDRGKFVTEIQALVE